MSASRLPMQIRPIDETLIRRGARYTNVEDLIAVMFMILVEMGATLQFLTFSHV